MKIIAYILFVFQIISLFGGRGFSINLMNLLENLLFMNGVAGFMFFLGSIFPTILGIMFLNMSRKRKAKKQAKQYGEKAVAFYCPDCGDVRDGEPGEAQGCPNCHKPAQEKAVLWKDWMQMTPEARKDLKQSWHEA